MSPSPADGPPWHDTAGDLARGRRVRAHARRVNLACFVTMVVMAVLVLTQVPPDTTASYARLSQSYELPVWALLLTPLVTLPPYVQTRRWRDDPMSRHAGQQVVVAVIAFVVVFGGMQALLSWAFLVEGGAI